MEKKNLRKNVRQLKSAYTPEQLVELSVEVIDKLKSHPRFQSAQTICLYSSLSDEVDTHGLIEELKCNKRIVLPSVEGDDIVLHVYTGSDGLAGGEYGILESLGEVFEQFEEIDLVVVPGMAFDGYGNRLGRGKGYYDRFLSKVDAYRIGVCFPFQYFESIPHDSHDICMDEVIC